jgi:hypothetical protein
VPTYGFPNVGDHRSGREGWTTSRGTQRTAQGG